MATIFWFIRQFVIPNPFDALGEGLTLMIGASPLVLSPEILNWIADPIIFAITFVIVGLYYISGSAPAWGSFLYMFFYCVHIAGLYLLLTIYPVVWLMKLCIGVYIALHIIVLTIARRADFI